MPFDEVQIKALDGKLSARHVKTRQQNGRTLSYIEGWHAVAEANRIFGFDGWDRRTVSSSCVWQGKIGEEVGCTYSVRVRITVRAGDTVVTREGSGCGHGKAPTLGQACEIALKAAETDATKRALATFGNPFGLALYDREQKGVRQRALKPRSIKRPYQVIWELRSETGEPIGKYDDPAAYCAASADAIERISDAGKLGMFWRHNQETLARVQNDLPKLTNDEGPHFAEIVGIAYAKRLNVLDVQSKNESPRSRKSDAGSPGRISDRIRNNDHLRFVASHPCLICRRKPSEAHHIRFAQKRGLGVKVGDNWTVPLCPVHHRALHDHGNEKDWWRRRGTDPLQKAEQLWRNTLEGGPPPTNDD